MGWPVCSDEEVLRFPSGGWAPLTRPRASAWPLLVTLTTKVIFQDRAGHAQGPPTLGRTGQLLEHIRQTGPGPAVCSADQEHCELLVGGRELSNWSIQTMSHRGQAAPNLLGVKVWSGQRSEGRAESSGLDCSLLNSGDGGVADLVGLKFEILRCKLMWDLSHRSNRLTRVPQAPLWAAGVARDRRHRYAHDGSPCCGGISLPERFDRAVRSSRRGVGSTSRDFMTSWHCGYLGRW